MIATVSLLVKSTHPVKSAPKIVAEMTADDLSALEKAASDEVLRSAREKSEDPGEVTVKASIEKTEAFPTAGRSYLGALLATLKTAVAIPGEIDEILPFLADRTKEPADVVNWLLDRQLRGRQRIRLVAKA